jgi:pimeloyl-ACP methyl ester carboxylesterase
MRWIIFLLIAGSVRAAEVSPTLTDKNIRTVKGNHQYYLPVRDNGKVLITIGGTNSAPAEFKNVHQWALAKGYRVLGVDYENEVISTLCQNNSDRTCFDKYRDEIVFGQEGSSLVKVNETNSISNRLLRLLIHLRWSVLWENVVLVGHSQGAGHVAYLAKHFRVSKVIMTGGPHDFYPGFGPAAWTLAPSMTDPSLYTSFLHWKDFFGTETQVGSSKALMGNVDVISIHDSITREGQIYISDLPFQDPHNSFTDLAYKKVWDKLLE